MHHALGYMLRMLQGERYSFWLQATHSPIQETNMYMVKIKVVVVNYYNNGNKVQRVHRGQICLERLSPQTIA